MNQTLLSSKNNNWCTPQLFLTNWIQNFILSQMLRQTKNLQNVKIFFTPEQDGLLQSWERSDGAVFCNPPYGREIGKWVKKAFEESKKHSTKIVLLIPARTDTKYFHEYIYGCAEIRFIKGRLKFTDESGQIYDPAPFPSMVVIYN